MSKIGMVIGGVGVTALVGAIFVGSNIESWQNANLGFSCGGWYHTEAEWDEYEQAIRPLMEDYIATSDSSVEAFDGEAVDKLAGWVLALAGCDEPSSVDVLVAGNQLNHVLREREDALADAERAAEEVAREAEAPAPSSGEPGDVDLPDVNVPHVRSPFDCSWSFRGGVNCGVRG